MRMLTKVSICVALLLSVPALPQAVSPVSQDVVASDDRMATPPPVSGMAFPTKVLAEHRSNYLSGGMNFETSYIDNFNPENEVATISEMTYSLMPTVDLDLTTPVRHVTIVYSPGFTFYEPTSTLNEVDHNLRVSYAVRTTPHSSVRLHEGFQNSSTSFGVAASVAANGVTGSIPTITPGIIAPFAQRLTNDADGEFTLQTGRNTMVGASGTSTMLRFPKRSEVPGLFDSDSQGGSGFYSARLSRRQYLGASYSYSRTLTTISAGTGGETQTYVISPFYSFYPVERLSVSVSGGPQHYKITQTSLSDISSWRPSVSATVGWQGTHTSFSANYSQAVTAGGGLLGGYRSRSAEAIAQWQMSRKWTAGADASYGINVSLSPLLLNYQGGHSVSGQATVQHAIGRQITLQFEYDRVHQSYGGIKAISLNPDSDRVGVSVSWQFIHPLGL